MRKTEDVELCRMMIVWDDFTDDMIRYDGEEKEEEEEEVVEEEEVEVVEVPGVRVWGTSSAAELRGSEGKVCTRGNNTWRIITN